mmetsp:Transcript_5996/g.8320  ORF Transcript_5996/g.8320 Transcript_5996/m.8320 type:complete len:109 (+) Transcript_5996:14-340(+)
MASSETPTPPPDQKDEAEKPVLGLPAPSDFKGESKTASGDGIKFDKLGPVVLNSDGTISRIANWHKMTKREQDLTYKRIVKRNNERRQALLAEMGKQNSKQEGYATSS